jgi:hypothetical protein
MTAKSQQKEGIIQVWARKIDWRHRVKAVCKPCWELKYCPYGPLVETFPLRPEREERSCRIFGHDCPVFSVAEPLTETRELRNISRNIPRSVQFRVLKRENSVCRRCGQPVKDEDIHFDHIIPWVKGGPSEEHNVQLLCRKCNLKKGPKFEDEYLISSLADHVTEPHGPELLEFLTYVVEFSHGFRQRAGHFPDATEMAKELAGGDVSPAEERAVEVARDMDAFFHNRPPRGTSKPLFRALRCRWGYQDGRLRRLKEAAAAFSVDPGKLLTAELDLISRLGFPVKLSRMGSARWLRR